MRHRSHFNLLLGAAVTFSGLGCSDGVGDAQSTSGAGLDEGVEIAVPVPDSGRAFVDLSVPAAIPSSEVPGDGASGAAWDIAFEGYEVFTNSGVSGPGKGGALGPYGPDIYVSGKDPA